MKEQYPGMYWRYCEEFAYEEEEYRNLVFWVDPEDPLATGSLIRFMQNRYVEEPVKNRENIKQTLECRTLEILL